MLLQSAHQDLPCSKIERQTLQPPHRSAQRSPKPFSRTFPLMIVNQHVDPRHPIFFAGTQKFKQHYSIRYELKKPSDEVQKSNTSVTRRNSHPPRPRRSRRQVEAGPPQTPPILRLGSGQAREGKGKGVHKSEALPQK